MKKMTNILWLSLLLALCGCGNAEVEARVYEHVGGKIPCVECNRTYYDYEVTGLSSSRKTGKIWEVTFKGKCPKHGDIKFVVECTCRNDGKIRIVRYVE